ncbi:MAG: YfiR family protein [Methylacidiphilales bacterium]|nr:YfiR family protein [Candidatus Methylacidiphilales bacterium]
MGRAEAQSKEYQLKAAFLYNFAQFVKWPTSSFATSDTPFYIGVLGDDPFEGALEKIIQGESIDNHRLAIIRSQRVEDLKDCQLLFISKSEDGHVGQILSSLDARPILMVSEIGGFAQSGGAINLYLQEGKVRFSINPEAAQRRGLRISSQLLSLGKVVEGGN